MSEIEKERECLTAFQIYYKALATGSEIDMLSAAREFMKEADQHYIFLATNKVHSFLLFPSNTQELS